MVESGTSHCPTPQKYRYLTDGEEDGDDEFHWLTPEEFVARYKESKYFEAVRHEIEEANRMNDGGDSPKVQPNNVSIF